MHRSIPAHAGEPAKIRPGPHPTGVYPRACGGTIQITIATEGERGLSPRMRGNPGIFSDSFAELGSIPAHAGEPLFFLLSVSISRVYPRACGGTIPRPW